MRFSSCRSVRFLASIALASLALSPLNVRAAETDGDLVVAPDSTYVAMELHEAHDIIAESNAVNAVHVSPVSEAQISRPAPIPFVPFPVIDPKTKKPIAPSGTITLHNGKTVNAGAYWAQVNDLEKRLNSAGASLRINTPVVTARFKSNAAPESGLHVGAHGALVSSDEVASTIAAFQSGAKGSTTGAIPNVVRPKALAPLTAPSAPNASGNAARDAAGISVLSCLNGTSHVNAQDNDSRPTPSQAKGIATNRDLAPANAGAIQQAQAALASANLKCFGPPVGSPTTFDHADLDSLVGSDTDQKPSYVLGDKSIAALDFSGDLAIGASKNAQGAPAPTINAVMAADGYLFNHMENIASATAQTGGTKDTSVDVSVVGQSVFNKSIKAGHIKDSTSHSYTIFNLDVPIPIVAGITVDLSASVAGKLGAGYDINISETSLVDSINVDLNGALAGTFSASINADAYIIDIQAGVKADFTFAKFDVPANAAFGLTMLDQTIAGAPDVNPRHIRDCQLNLGYLAQVSANLDALSGTITAYAKECVDYVFDTSCYAEQDAAIYSSTGYKGTYTQGISWKQLAIGPVYTDGPQYGIALTGNQRYSPDDPKTAVPLACEDFPIQFST